MWLKDGWMCVHMQEELYGLEGRPLGASTSRKDEPETGSFGAPSCSGERHHGRQWLLIKFDSPVTAPPDALVVGARLDMDVHGDSCRQVATGGGVEEGAWPCTDTHIGK